MEEKSVKCPLEVISFEGQQICFDPAVDGFAPRLFGSGLPVPMTPALQAAIEEEQARQQRKRRPAAEPGA